MSDIHIKIGYNAGDKNTDYKIFKPHSDNSNDGCLLGKKETFERLHRDSWCYNGYSYERTSDETLCACKKLDYECDYGFFRKPGEEVGFIIRGKS